jgi:hypothetical protein
MNERLDVWRFSQRQQVDIVDGSIRLAAHLTGQGKKGAERRQAMSGVQVGTSALCLHSRHGRDPRLP